MNEERWELFFQLGMEHYQKEDWAQACEAFQVSLEEAQTLPAPDLRLARSLNNLACALSQMGQFAQSVGLQEQSLILTRQLMGDRHELVAGALLNLASDYAKMQRFGESEAHFLKALEIIESPSLRIQALENLVQFYLAQEKLQEALERLLSLKELVQKQPDHLARVLHSLTHVYDALGQTAQADESRQQVLTTIEGLWGEKNMAYAEVVANLAESLMAQQRLLPAAELYQKAARSFATCIPHDDPRYVGCLLGELIGFRDGGQPENALARAAQVEWRRFPLEIQRRWLNEVGLAYFMRQDYPQAASHFEQSLGLEGDVPVAARISMMFNLGSAHMGAGRHQEALPILESIAGLSEEHLQPDHPMTVRAWLQLQELYRLTGQDDKVEAIEKKLTRVT